MAPSSKTPARKSPAKAAKAATAAKAVKAVAKAAGKVAAKAKAVAKPKAAEGGEEEGGLKVRVGDAAPDFRLQDDAGGTVTLSGLRGKKVVLYFYPKDSTPGCTTEACDFRDNLGRLAKGGAVVLGLSADSVESHRKFKAKQGLNFPLVSDPERKALEAYGVWQEKTLYGRKFMGIVRSTVLIDEKGKVSKVWPRVKVAGHVDEVLASL